MADLEIVKISELPEASSFANLFTIGTDALMRSVKVSLAALASIPGLSSSVQALSTQISGIETAMAQMNSRITSLGGSVGDLSGLETAVKTSIVAAINELVGIVATISNKIVFLTEEDYAALSNPDPTKIYMTYEAQ